MASEHYKNLDRVHAQRYMEKISSIGYEDPYCMEDCSRNIADLPPVLYPDIVNYLVFANSAYKMEQFKAYKGLQSYKAASCGWVRELRTKIIEDYIVVLGKVLHSQKLNVKPLNPWIICEKSGTIKSAHCDCVAGLGETCTHVAAVLFSIDNLVRPNISTHYKSVTDEKAYWVAPSNKPSAPSEVCSIDFTKPGTSKIVLETPITHVGGVSSLNREGIVNLLHTLKDTRHGATLHRIVSPFNREIEESTAIQDNFNFTSLYKPEYQSKDLEELIKIGEALSLEISFEECRKIARATSTQNKSQEWFLYRSGRVTASNFMRTCRTKIDNPSHSLIKSICYPTKYSFTSKQTSYGCKHEKIALIQYEKMMQTKHVNFDVEASGLVINPAYPYFGASPNGLTQCDCHGLGCVEVKCPYCAKDVGIEEMVELKKTYLEKKSGNVSLKKCHLYYYQVQMQMALCGLTFCDFVVWSPKDVFIQRIDFDEVFWLAEHLKAKNFFFKVLMPELLGKYFTKTGRPQKFNVQDDMQSQPVIEHYSSEDEPMEEITIIFEDEGISLFKINIFL